ncbi:Succinate dehydrogenase assembly factor 3, mitochondrial [Clonorchis sinensis]|uniref:Succinate dehydrogenase assembly factor 3 n=2 Tax=Clonorchis sinensis TaxID=79923 RepID=G7YHN1_CLOSI|nr:Succinate dehydrogenase assembly factor 3, mitochondrial [Clonorchis sinensis]GAA52464.1 protein ACN9 homolog mitochondrial [Clonorchis sinensis]
MSVSNFTSLTHPQRVRYLYKSILRLHRALPPDMAELGNRYVREEFRKHKNSSPEFIHSFMVEWSRYAVELSKQVRNLPRSDSEEYVNIGKVLDESQLKYFNEAQLEQLLELAKEIHSPANSSGAAP